MKYRSRTGQSILEYTLILGAVISVVVWAIFGAGGVKTNVENAYKATGTALETTTGDLQGGVFK